MLNAPLASGVISTAMVGTSYTSRGRKAS
jgi:hypothetical protein